MSRNSRRNRSQRKLVKRIQDSSVQRTDTGVTKNRHGFAVMDWDALGNPIDLARDDVRRIHMHVPAYKAASTRNEVKAGPGHEVDGAYRPGALHIHYGLNTSRSGWRFPMHVAGPVTGMTGATLKRAQPKRDRSTYAYAKRIVREYFMRNGEFPLGERDAGYYRGLLTLRERNALYRRFYSIYGYMPDGNYEASIIGADEYVKLERYYTRSISEGKAKPRLVTATAVVADVVPKLTVHRRRS